MHQTGVRMTNEVIRDNEIVHTSKADVFEFDQQGAFLVQQEPFEVKPGDAFRTSCYYRDGADFGLSSQEEMCIAYVMYYPAKVSGNYPWMCPYGLGIPVCSQELGRFDLEDAQGLDRVFGASNEECAMTDPTTSNDTVGDGETSSSARAGANTVFFITLIGTSFLYLAFGL
mmetsp:Transcript_4379/g.10298  ORF Transcript_4379/g.10298 Transcript_4379/m.10298 type:complete len:171 (-) Transcript_4379:157-669(-)